MDLQHSGTTPEGATAASAHSKSLFSGRLSSRELFSAQSTGAKHISHVDGIQLKSGWVSH